MTDKDSNDMTASEMLRKADSHPCSMCHLVMDGDESCATTGCASWAYRLADKIDAELVEARNKGISLSLSQGAKLWAKANGWPDFRDGEDFGAWLERCALKLPCDKDGEPWSIGDRVIPGNRSESTVTGYDFDGNEWFLKYRWCGIDSYANEFATSCKRPAPAPEVLGADGLPLDEDDTVYGMGREQHRYTVQVPYSINEVIGQRFCVQCYDHDEGNITWCDPSMLTHTPPDTLERLRDDMYRTAEEWREADSVSVTDMNHWANRLTALIERMGGAE